VDRLTGVELLSFPDPVFLDRLVIDVSSFASVDVATPLQVGSVSADAMVGLAKSTNAFFGLAGGDTLTGGDQADMLSGGDDDDLLSGGAGDDSLYGGDGADRLDGGRGADKMAGGTGNDVYEVDDAGDTVTELTGEGVDEVRTGLGSRSDYSLIYVLPDHVEKLTGTSATGQGVQANALDNLVAMGAGDDLVVLDGGGNDTVTAGSGNDFLYYGGALTNGDSNNGGAGHDTIGLLGTYRLAFDADDLVSIEKLAVYASGNAAAPNTYDLTTHDRNVAPGETLTVIALSLAAGETLRFNGAAETDGAFAIYSGKGSDTITGGAGHDTIYGNLGADTLKGGGGNDVFVYQSAAESRLGAADVILDFSRGDRINLTAIDADGNAANGNTAFAWLGTGAFTGQAGQLRVSPHPQHDRAWLVEGDTDGDGAADFLLYLVAEPGLVSAAGRLLAVGPGALRHVRPRSRRRADQSGRIEDEGIGVARGRGPDLWGRQRRAPCPQPRRRCRRCRCALLLRCRPRQPALGSGKAR
jgi:Ca2+-binding RTX toxin-like protein